MLGLYRKRNYDNSDAMLRLINSRKDIVPQTIAESMSYANYYAVSSWCKKDHANRRLYVLQANPFYITLELEIKSTINYERTNS